MGTGITGKGVKKNNYISKDLMPGIVEARIVGLAVVKKEKVMNKEGYPEYELKIKLEGPNPSPDFEGWDKDPQDPSKGKYKGPYKEIKSGKWPIKKFTYTDKRTQKEITISAESQILSILQEIAEAYGKPNLFDEKQYQKEFATWSDYIKQMNQDLQFQKHYIFWCLGGTKTKNPKGYIIYFLNMPDKRICQNKPRIAAKKEDLCEYIESEMVDVNQKSFDQNSNINNKSDNPDDEEFSTEALDTEDADFGNTDIGEQELFEGIDEFDEFASTGEDNDVF